MTSHGSRRGTPMDRGALRFGTTRTIRRWAGTIRRWAGTIRRGSGRSGSGSRMIESGMIGMLRFWMTIAFFFDSTMDAVVIVVRTNYILLTCKPVVNDEAIANI